MNRVGSSDETFTHFPRPTPAGATVLSSPCALQPFSLCYCLAQVRRLRTLKTKEYLTNTLFWTLVGLSSSSSAASSANTTQEKCSSVDVCFRNGDFYDPCTISTDDCPPCVDLVYTYYTCYEKTTDGDCSMHFDCSAFWDKSSSSTGSSEASSSSAAVTVPQSDSSSSNSARGSGLSATLTIVAAAISALVIGF